MFSNKVDGKKYEFNPSTEVEPRSHRNKSHAVWEQRVPCGVPGCPGFWIDPEQARSTKGKKHTKSRVDDHFNSKEHKAPHTPSTLHLPTTPHALQIWTFEVKVARSSFT